MVRGTVTDWTEYCQNKVSSLFRRSEPGNEYELWEGLAMFLYLGKRMLNCTLGKPSIKKSVNFFHIRGEGSTPNPHF